MYCRAGRIANAAHTQQSIFCAFAHMDTNFQCLFVLYHNDSV